jgi:APA family basic amino acid/polyamine antiporter
MATSNPNARNPAPSGSLLRILGLGFGIAISIGGSIGVGILRAPGIVAAQLPHPGWIMAAWAAGGLYAFLGTVCVIELGTSVPKAGGWYAYAREAFGEFPAFVVGWSFWLTLACSMSYGSVAMCEYLGELVPALAGLGKPLGTAILVAFLLFQLTGLKPVSRLLEVTGFLKGIVFLLLIGACFLIAPHRTGTAAPAASSSPPGWLFLPALVFALQAIVQTYDGWQMPCCFTEEDRNPTRNLPRAMMLGTGILIVIYVGMNLALLTILSVPEMAGSKLAAATAFAKIFGSLTGRIITSIAIVNILGLLNSNFLLTSRVLFAMARDALFFHGATRVSRTGVPVFGTVFTGAAALLVMLFSGSFERIFSIAAILNVVCYAAGYGALIVLRVRKPDLPRPFKVWGYPVVPLVALVGSVLFLWGTVAEDPTGALLTLGLIAVSYPTFLLMRRAQRQRAGALP